MLSHWDGAALLELLPVRSGFVDVTVRTAAGRRRRPEIRIHRCPSLTDDEVTQQKRIPVTTPARTIKDLRRTAPAAVVRRAIRNAEFRDLPLGTVSTDRTRSELERKLLAICRRHRLPSPEVNVPVGPYTVDFLWREQRLVVEVDGYRAHHGRQAFEDDRERDRRLALLGYRVLRFP